MTNKEGQGRVAEAVAEACRLLDEPGEPLTLAELAAKLGLSPYYLQRSFKRLVGSTPRQYGAAIRLERAKQGLRDGLPVTASLYDAGYRSSRAFYEDATDALGMRPSTYRRGGHDLTIRYTMVGSPLGPLLIAATERGVCAVRFLDGTDGTDDQDANAGEGLLRAEFPAADLVADDEGLREMAAGVVAAVEGRSAGAGDLPLDVRATAFQLEVYRALRAIPCGETRSYTDVARAIGRPAAVRAVARACATNPVAVVVPCHRVVAANGGMAGYRWGLARKQALLAAEKDATRS